MQDDDELFAGYVREYDLRARAEGWPLYSSDPQELADATVTTGLNLLGLSMYGAEPPRAMTTEQRAEFKAEFYRALSEGKDPLARIGFETKKQRSGFGTEGAKYNKGVGERNREAVLAQASKILAERNRKPGTNELAGLIAPEVGLAVSTVKNHLRKLKLLD